MGEVYQARDTRLDRIVALKVLAANLGVAPDACDRFRREARSIAALNHSHICTLYDVGQQQGVDYLVMEYLEGETMASLSFAKTVADHRSGNSAQPRMGRLRTPRSR
jgi:eukaryotic-like serine/threonine-protein kinase